MPLDGNGGPNDFFGGLHNCGSWTMQTLNKQCSPMLNFSFAKYFKPRFKMLHCRLKSWALQEVLFHVRFISLICSNLFKPQCEHSEIQFFWLKCYCQAFPVFCTYSDVLAKIDRFRNKTIKWPCRIFTKKCHSMSKECP